MSVGHRLIQHSSREGLCREEVLNNDAIIHIQYLYNIYFGIINMC